jgi:hypothetical protein
MKAFAIIGAIGLVLSLATANTPVKDTDQISDPQTLFVPDYEVSFERGSYSILSPNYNKSTILSNEQLISILKSVGFRGDGLRMAWAVVQKESTARPYAHNDNPRTGDNSYGLFQINMKGSMGTARREKYSLRHNEDLYNPLINAQVAYQMSSGGKNWSAWSTKNSAKSIIKDFPN